MWRDVTVTVSGSPARVSGADEGRVEPQKAPGLGAALPASAASAGAVSGGAVSSRLSAGQCGTVSLSGRPSRRSFIGTG